MLKLLLSFSLCMMVAISNLNAQETGQSSITGKYWFDAESDYHSFIPGNIEVSTAGLDEGFHAFHAYITDGLELSSTHSRLFFKQGEKRYENEPITCNILIDGIPFKTETVNIGAEGILDLNIDLNDIDLGMHTLGISLFDSEGNLLGFRNSVFMRVPSALQWSTFKAYYYLDNEFIGIADPTSAESVFHLDIDVSALESGLHSFMAYLTSPYGMTSRVESAWFIKIPAGGEGVKSYSYWINDNKETLQAKTLPEVSNPYSLMALIDVPEQPFRSKSYTFAIEDNAPGYYACNDFKVQFIDPDNRASTASRTYTDTRTKYIPDEIISLSKEEHINTGVIPSNSIKLYRFDAEVGDSVNVRIGNAGMIELYSPTAQTLVRTSGVDATKYSTLTIRENGTHYIAVHDIASGNNTNFDFQHIHKFALLEQDVTTTANRGSFEMKVTGNGFESIKSLALVGNESEYEINQFRVVDNYTMYATFDFEDSDINIGAYRLKGFFTDKETESTEDILSSTILNVESATPVNIDVEIVAPRIAGTPYLTYIQVTNRSNVGVWGIPFNLAAQHTKNGGKIDFMNFGISLDKEYKDSIPVIHETENLLNSGQSGAFAPTVIPYLGPGKTKTYVLGFTTTAHEKVSLYAWAGTPWSESIREMQSDDFDLTNIQEPFEGNLFSFAECCKVYYQLANEELSSQIPETREIVDTAANLMKQAISSATECKTPRMTGQNMSLEMIGSNEYVNNEQNPDSCVLLVGNDLISSMISKDNPDVNIQIFNKVLNARNNWDTNVPPSPNPPVTLIDCFQSGDPNDITGYISPAGTHHIGKDVKSVSYTIEFENDPAIASAPASTIKVTSNIDRSIFDMTSVKAHKLKIGDKELELPEGHHFVKTLDMRPDINAIAELTFNFEKATGEVSWSIRSLDPLTLDDIKYMDDGILPVNDNSNRGIGYLTFSASLLSDIADNTTIQMGAQIIFDNNAPISTPTWKNTTDFTVPKAFIASQTTEDDQKFDFVVEGNDVGSGIWYYDLYFCPEGTDEWVVVTSQIENNTFSYVSEEPLENATFAILATDKAGNHQDKADLEILLGDVDKNGLIDANDVVTLRNYYLGRNPDINSRNADVNNDGVIDTQDATSIRNIYLEKQSKMTYKLIKIRK